MFFLMALLMMRLRDTDVIRLIGEGRLVSFTASFVPAATVLVLAMG